MTQLRVFLGIITLILSGILIFSLVPTKILQLIGMVGLVSVGVAGMLFLLWSISGDIVKIWGYYRGQS
jgi:hypothetical protein